MDTQAPHQVHPHHVHQRHFDRLVMLSDGIFAIALTLSAVELKPEMSPGKSLAQIWATPLGIYFLCFFIVSGVWARHRRTLAHLQKTDLFVTLSSLLMLSLVGLTPVFIREMLTDENTANVNGMLLYALLLMATYLSLFVGWGYAAFIARLAPSVPRPRAWAWLLEDLFVVVLFGAVALFSIHWQVLAGAAVIVGIALRIATRRLESAAKKLD
ncbi:TMEM175 family protein [Dyella sp. 2HG41-7]|uniref:TMEM175 family protein n=1 Tax=Dyella sp. 2HG41-7 TaxID=2883239 RepID=UPI001F1EA652|nr:TMEM175 family protein [Dyella sp. 2HG41-7]